jgi:hypothetical protein
VPLVVSRALGLPVFLLTMTPTEVPSPRAQIIAPDPGEPSIVVSTITSSFFGDVNREVRSPDPPLRLWAPENVCVCVCV